MFTSRFLLQFPNKYGIIMPILPYLKRRCGMRTQYLFLKFLRSFLVGLAVGIVTFGALAVILFALYLVYFA